MDSQDFYTEFREDVIAQSGAEETYIRSVFLEKMCQILEGEGIIPEYDLTEYKMTSGSKSQAVDAWAYDNERACFYLIINDYRDAPEITTLSLKELSALFRRLQRFVKSALGEEFASSLEESHPVTQLAYLFFDERKRIEKLHLIVVSNARLSSRISELPDEKVSGYPTTYDVWDFERIYNNVMSGRSKETIEITFDNLPDGGIPCLPAYTGSDDMSSYLLVMPGEVLADLYEEHGERLLEQNVRTFLQFRGKINKGIRNTIINEPQMFFSYNNGLSATAESVELNADRNRICRVRNLQIVNGGQTTASIFTARKKQKAELSSIYVQVKLSVIESDVLEEVVPKISQFSNTQNKVSASDFFSNHDFHTRMEEFSRRIFAPSKTGTIAQTHWFYERARGQYANQQANLTPAQKKKFRTQNPRKQMFTKTDLAKYILSFEEAPHEVSLGAQKAFSGTPSTKGLVGRIITNWDKHEKQYNELWFKRAVAKAIFFKDVDHMIFKSDWYSGYKANIVTYTLARFAYFVHQSGKCINFDIIWQKQDVPQELILQLASIAKAVNEVLLSPPKNTTSNVSEWAKKPACWEAVRKKRIYLENDVDDFLISEEESSSRERAGAVKQKNLNMIHGQTYVFEKGAEYWKKLRSWNVKNMELSRKEQSILEIACSIPGKYPSDKQSRILIEAEKRAKAEGFYDG